MLAMGNSMPFVRVGTSFWETKCIMPFHQPTRVNPRPLPLHHPILTLFPFKEKNYMMKRIFISGTVPKSATTTLPLTNPAILLLRQHEIWLGQKIPSHRPIIKQSNHQAFNLECTSCTTTDKKEDTARMILIAHFSVHILLLHHYKSDLAHTSYRYSLVIELYLS